MNEIKVRHATAAEARRLADFNRARALETEGLALSETTALAGVVSLMGHPERGFYLVAEVDGALAGSLLVTYEWSDWRNKTFWWISSLYVKPEMRGRGVYDALDQKLQEPAAQDGNVCGLRTYVHKSGKALQDVCRNLGMVEKEYVVFEDML